MDEMGGRLDEAAAGAPWQRTSLWRALEAMRVEPPGAALSFTARLAAENGWEPQFAEAVYAEYRRFLYLSANAEAPLTPSDSVDQAWHLHLAYSRHYWDILCGEILRRPFHHGPTSGGRAEAEKYRAQYQDTLDCYRSVFGVAPSEDIWPPANDRFEGRHIRIDASRYVLLPWNRWSKAGGIAAAVAFTGACSAAAEARLGDVFLLGYFLFFVVAAVAALRDRRRRRGDDGCDGFTFDGGDLGGCGGGCGGCGG